MKEEKRREHELEGEEGDGKEENCARVEYAKIVCFISALLFVTK
jgi:hypothetical protein